MKNIQIITNTDNREERTTLLVDLQNDMRIRTYNVLIRAGYRDLKEVAKASLNTLMNMKNAGMKTVNEVCRLIKKVLGDDRLFNEYEEYRINAKMFNLLKRIEEVNKLKNNRKVNLLINLAKNKAATFGEKRNSLLMSARILNVSLEL